MGTADVLLGAFLGTSAKFDEEMADLTMKRVEPASRALEKRTSLKLQLPPCLKPRRRLCLTTHRRSQHQRRLPMQT